METAGQSRKNDCRRRNPILCGECLMPFIIDGYNVLRAIEKLSDEFEPVSDLRMCQQINQYLKSQGEKGEIVFDGIGPPEKAGFNYLTNLEVIFSGTNTDADTIIAQKVAASTDPKRLIIVSSDRQVRLSAKSKKADVIKSVEFWFEVQKQLSRKRGIKEPDGKRKGINEAETDRWMDIFDLDEDAD